MRLSAARRTWERWLTAAGPWRLWSVCPLLLSPEIEMIEPRPPAPGLRARAERLADALASTLPQTPTLLLADLDLTLGIDLASTLYARRLAYPLLVVPRWPYAEAVLDASVPVWVLTRAAPDATSVDAACRHLCVVLDADRESTVLARSRRHATTADNRYQLGPQLLPALSDLRARGIERVVRLSSAPGARWHA